MTVVIPEIVSCYLYRYGYFEKDLTKVLINKLKEGDIFLDIGAHFGYYSLLASEILSETGSVHSFEPILSTFNIAQKNLRQKNIKLNNLAVWSERDKLKIKVYKTQFSAFNTIFSAKLDADTVKNLKYVENYIGTITIDDYVHELKIIPSFIKIDAENSEIEILKGMTNVLNSAKPIISIEMGDLDSKNSSSSRECVEFLMLRNYSPFEIHDGELKVHKIKNRYNHMNLIFKPN